MKYQCFIPIGVILIILSGCKSDTIDWVALLEAGNKELKTYRSTLSTDSYEKAMEIYEQVTEGSPEFRNSALMQSSVLLSLAGQFDEAVKVAEQISDTAKVLQMYCNKKTIYINAIYANKAMSKFDIDEYNRYSKKITDEMCPWLYDRKQLIYEAINEQYEFSPDNQTMKLYNPSLQALSMYFMALAPEEAREEINNWKTGVPEPNEATEAFFSFFNF